MKQHDAQQLARIRFALRDQLMSRRHEGCEELLQRLYQAACQEEGSRELRNEYERWRMRFELLAA